MDPARIRLVRMAIANRKSKIENVVLFCLLLASACAPTPAPVQPPAERIAATLGPGAAKEILWDGFEEGNRWTVEAADDPAALRVSPEWATEERVALKVDFEAAGRGKVHLRRETRLDI
ncbi:MAG: hypothetical protein FJ279_10935, partial [Planctomycetes bacterium]|nr:hypothetical protein [Planctomycetota bacterium]